MSSRLQPGSASRHYLDSPAPQAVSVLLYRGMARWLAWHSCPAPYLCHMRASSPTASCPAGWTICARQLPHPGTYSSGMQRLQALMPCHPQRACPLGWALPLQGGDLGGFRGSRSPTTFRQHSTTSLEWGAWTRPLTHELITDQAGPRLLQHGCMWGMLMGSFMRVHAVAVLSMLLMPCGPSCQ